MPLIKESYETDNTSKVRERAAKDPYILEYNIMGTKFREGKITGLEWKAFNKEWETRFKIALNNSLKQRLYKVKEII